MRPLIVGIAGDSGTGKTTFVRELACLLGEDQTTLVDLDGYHTLDRQQRRALGITPLDPRANDLPRIAEHARALRSGQPVDVPTYDHTTGTFGPTRRVEPRPFVILEGLLPFHLPEACAAFDVRIYFDTHPEVKLKWKIDRDVAERGHRLEDVMEEIIRRLEDFRRYVDPQKVHADLLVSYVPAQLNGNGRNPWRQPWVWVAERAERSFLTERVAEEGRRWGVRAFPYDCLGVAFAALEIRDGMSGGQCAALLEACGVDAPLVRRARASGHLSAAQVAQFLVAWRLEHERAVVVRGGR